MSMSIEELQERWRVALSNRGRCPRCGSQRVWHNGLRRRKASLQCRGRTEYVGDVPVRRLRCALCGKRWRHAPEQIVSRNHYQPCVVAQAVARDALDREADTTTVAREHGCHRRTIGRWVARVAGLAEPGRLARTLVLESATVVVPSPPLPRPRRSARLSTLCLRAVAVLALLEALASLRGLAPPGLAHASLFVPAHAPPSVRPGGARSLV